MQCEGAAKTATEPDARRVYLDVARQWRDRAAHTEKLERLLTSSSRNGSNAGERHEKQTRGVLLVAGAVR